MPSASGRTKTRFSRSISEAAPGQRRGGLPVGARQRAWKSGRPQNSGRGLLQWPRSEEGVV